MRTTTVADVMTADPVTVDPDAPFHEVVELITTNGISAVPVVDQELGMLGVVSKADLLGTQEQLEELTGRQPRQPRRRREELAARDLMTLPVLAVPPEASLPSAARRLARAGVDRLFVVDGRRLVGVLTRRDMLRAFLRDDQEIRAEIEQEVFGRVFRADPAVLGAAVDNGVVTLTGRLEYEADITMATRIVESIPGVVTVHNQMDYVWRGTADSVRDDTEEDTG